MAEPQRGLPAGKLRYRVTLEAPPDPEATDPTTGEAVEQWRVVARVWADVRTPSGHELVHANQEQAEADSVVEIRWRDGLEGVGEGRRMRLRFRDRVLNIDAAVDPENLRVRLLLFCTEPR